MTARERLAECIARCHAERTGLYMAVDAQWWAQERILNLVIDAARAVIAAEVRAEMARDEQQEPFDLSGAPAACADDASRRHALPPASQAGDLSCLPSD